MANSDDDQIVYVEQVFEDVDLTHKEFVSKKFNECTFDKCDLSYAVFRNCRFLNCTFQTCNLSLVDVTGSSFAGVVFSESNVIGVNWTKASWPKGKPLYPIEFLKCNLNHSTFIGLNLHGIRIEECLAKEVDFRDADLTKADLSYTDFIGSLFLNTNLRKADLTGSKNYAINITLNKVEKAKFSFPEAMSLLYNLDIELVVTE